MKKLLVSLLTTSILSMAGCATTDNLVSRTASPSATAFSSTPPKKIALLLPLNSNVANQAKTIQSGFFSAYFNDKKTNPNVPEINVINTSDQTINDAYNKAVTAGANLVVGPLQKQEVKTLKNRRDLTVPVLALNSLDNNQANPAVIEFSLSPQDEAEQIADHANRNGRHRALVITLAGEWGQGIQNSFSTRWQQQGNTLVASLQLKSSDNVNETIKNFLSTRHQDFDVIFLATPASVARQVNPLLSYYGAKDIPVYATSMVYTGANNPGLDKDLEGITFCDVAGVFSSAATSKPASRLYAFGADSYFLANHLGALIAGTPINGNTGQLHLSASNQVKRNLVFGTFHDGVPQANT